MIKATSQEECNDKAHTNFPYDQRYKDEQLDRIQKQCSCIKFMLVRLAAAVMTTSATHRHLDATTL